MALKLEASGISTARQWLSLQLNYDLSVSDEKIISDFTEWLKKRREANTGNFKRLSDSEIKKLKQGGIIPCMDLLIWEKYILDSTLKCNVFRNGAGYAELPVDFYHRENIKIESDDQLVKIP